MKTLIIFGTFLVLPLQVFGYVPPSDGGCNCGGGSYQKCCTTSGGSTYYGICLCN